MEISETHISDKDGVCILRETVFVDSLLPDEQIFENLKVKVEPVFVDDEEEIIMNVDETISIAKDKVQKKTETNSNIGNGKKKTPKNRVAAMKEKIENSKLKKKLNNQKSVEEDGRLNPDVDVFKTFLDDDGREVTDKMKETIEERRRRLARDRMRRIRMNMTVFERQTAMRKQRIQKQKLRLRQRLEETEEEAETRRKEYREQKRKSRQKLRDVGESTNEEDSRRYLSSFTTPDGDVIYETLVERERRLARERQRRRRFRLSEIDREIELEHVNMNTSSLEQTQETEDEKEIRRLKYKLLKRRNRDEMSELIDNEEPDLLSSTDIDDVTISQQESFTKFCKSKKKKRAPDDIEYLYFYENSEDRRKRLDRERHKAKYLARKQMEREVLDMEEESNPMTSRRCLDIE